MSYVLSITYPEAISMAVEVLKVGGLVVLPTDTVYGVASILDAEAIDHIFVAKQRPPEKAVPVLLSDIHAVEQVATSFPDSARRLAEAFWPGPLTLTLPKRADLPHNLSTLLTVGVRVPDQFTTRALIAAAGGALAVTSANLSDSPPAQTIFEAIDYLSDRVSLYLDGGPCQGGLPSTVVAFEGDDWQIVRPGPISEDMLQEALSSRRRPR
jgi:L-threonylcarbamoyladenylate synthase